ncbi:hypothetical protein B0H14DRAFT_2614354 [Mycena olivaceomarginata]|nr:hypothetical protein B0H14DRAFT_2614354 [Mycena olivaceomarginata]
MEQDIYHYVGGILNIAANDIALGAPAADVQAGLDKAISLFRTIENSPGLNYCDVFTADLALRENDIDTARTIFEKCARTSGTSDNEVLMTCLERLADGRRWSFSDLHSMSTWTII